MAERKVNILMVLLCSAYLFDYGDRMIMASLLNFIKADWGCSDVQLGMLTSVVSLFIAIFVLPLSILVDRWSRRRMIAIMVFLWSIATLASAFVLNYNQLLWARAITGIGEAAYAPASIALIAMMYPLAQRAKYTGIWNAFAPMGAAIGFILGGIIGSIYGWRHALGLMALPGILIAIMFWRAHDYETQPMGHDKEGNPIAFSIKSMWRSILDLLKIRTLVFLFGGFAFNMAINSSILTWFPSYLVRYFDMNEKTAGKLSGAIALLALIGTSLGGYWADKWFKKQSKARLYLPIITSLITSVLLLIALLMQNIYVAVPMFLLFGLSAVVYLAPATAAMQDVVKPGMRAVSFGLNVVCMNLCGAFWAPILVGKLSDMYNLHTAMMILPLCGIGAAVMFYYASKSNASGG